MCVFRTLYIYSSIQQYQAQAFDEENDTRRDGLRLAGRVSRQPTQSARPKTSKQVNPNRCIQMTYIYIFMCNVMKRYGFSGRFWFFVCPQHTYCTQQVAVFV